MKSKTVSFGLFLFCVPFLGISALCYYYGMTTSLDSNGNAVSCEPDTERAIDGGLQPAKMSVPCGAPGADSKCHPHTQWQTNVDNVSITMLVLTCILASTLLCYGFCKKIKFEEANFFVGILFACVMSAILVVFWVMGFLGIYAGLICRGKYLDDFDNSGIENYKQPINGWSLEPIRFLDSGELVPGYNKSMSVLMRYIAFYQLAVYIMILILIAFVDCLNVDYDHFADFFPTTRKKVA